MTCLSTLYSMRTGALALVLLGVCMAGVQAQTATLEGRIWAEGRPVAYASLFIEGGQGAQADSIGRFRLAGLPGSHVLVQASALGYQKQQRWVNLQPGQAQKLDFTLAPDGRAMDEVVVTGVTRATKALRNPQPTSVMSRNEINLNANGNAVDAAVRGVPGLSAVTTGPNISKPFIRGLGYNRVLVLYDGIRQESQQWGQEHGTEIDPYGIGRVEVVKGPASLAYGSDALAGVVNFLPYLPAGGDKAVSGEFASEFQTNNGMAGLSGAAAYRYGGWTFMGRATQKLAHDYRSPVDGYVFNTGYRETILTGSARRDWKNNYSQFALTWYENLQEIPDGSRDSATRAFTRQVSESADDLKHRPLVPQSDYSRYAINSLHQHIQHGRAYSRSRFQLGEGALSMNLAAQRSVRQEFNHPTDPSQPGLNVVLNTYTYQIAYEAPSWQGIEATAGLGGMYQQNRSANATAFPLPDYNLFDLGAFATARTSLGRWDLSGGIRMDGRRLNWQDQRYRTDEHGYDRPTSASDPTARLVYPSFDRLFTGVSASLGSSYRMAEGVYLKANLARGYRAPAVTELGANGLDPGAHIVYLGNRSFVPEVSTQGDLGLSAARKEWDYSLSLFANHIQHFIYLARAVDENGQPLVIVPGNATYTYRSAPAFLYGGEATATWHPSALPAFSFINAVAVTEGRNLDADLRRREGPQARYLPFIPPLTARSEVRLTAQKPWGCISKPFVRVEGRACAAQNHFYGIDGTETATPGYVLLNTGIGTSLTDTRGTERLRLIAQVDNVFNTAYQSNLSRLKYFEYFAASPNGRSGIYNMGRNLSVKATWLF